MNNELFQSTPPARGATDADGQFFVGIIISIHAPREGGDTDELFYDLFRKEMGEYHVKTTVDDSRRRDREVGQHEV